MPIELTEWSMCFSIRLVWLFYWLGRYWFLLVGLFFTMMFGEIVVIIEVIVMGLCLYSTHYNYNDFIVVTGVIITEVVLSFVLNDYSIIFIIQYCLFVILILFLIKMVSFYSYHLYSDCYYHYHFHLNLILNLYYIAHDYINF